MNESQRLPAIISLVLMIATMSLGWFTWSRGRLPQKLMESRTGSPVPPGEQDVVARLWEDPLQAVHPENSRHRISATDPNHSIASVAQSALLKTGEDGKFLLLVMLVPGGPFPDDTETRLRTRYALQMAMAERRYAPDDREHLGFFVMPWFGIEGPHAGNECSCSFAPIQDFGTNEHHHAIRVPFEWFLPQAPDSHKRPPVLVLWLPEETLRFEPLCMLAFLSDGIAGDQGRLQGQFVVGPRSSDTLKRIAAGGTFARRNQDGSHVCVDLLHGRFRIFSSQATAPDGLLGIQPHPERHRARTSLNEELTDLLRKSSSGASSDCEWVYLTNMIPLDDQLTDVLVSELAQRRIIGRGGDDGRILLVAEADTSYGRSLPLAFAASLESFKTQGVAIARASTTATALTDADRISGVGGATLSIARYLRGLDKSKGSAPMDASRKASLPSRPEEAIAEVLRAVAAPAWGESQLDYAERLAARIRATPDAKRVRAVGIFGADVQDKLILLQALRPQFPGTVFFTTDLDARLWHPDHISYTRNLIVASGAATEAPERSSFQMASFRDGYQVAAYDACRAALIDSAAPGAKPSEPLPSPEPRIFEIGRKGPVELACHSAATARRTLRIRAEPARWWLALAGLGGALFIWHRSVRDPEGWTFRNLWNRHTGWLGWFAVFTAASILTLALIARAASQQPGGEPLVWVQGVSSWPTELARVAILGCILWMFAFIWTQHQRSCLQWAQTYFGDLSAVELTGSGCDSGKEGTRPVSLRQLGERLRRRLAEALAPWPQHVGPAPDARVNVRRVFKMYLRKSAPSSRLIRVGIGTAVYLAFAFGLMHALGGLPDNSNIRGTAAHLADGVLLFSLVPAFCALVFFVIDDIWQAAQLLRRIGEPLSEWPPIAQRRYHHYGLAPEHLEGLNDVQFAAEITRNAGHLVLLPFVIQLAIIACRNRIFDNWSWPPVLLFILVCNIGLAGVGWFVLRRAARLVRFHALQKVNRKLLEIQRARVATQKAHRADLERMRISLAGVRAEIEAERRGAYAHLIQDPALLAVLIPTGVLGIVVLLFHAIFGQV